jgi:NADPH-dependent ferric siderophore reductase
MKTKMHTTAFPFSFTVTVENESELAELLARLFLDGSEIQGMADETPTEAIFNRFLRKFNSDSTCDLYEKLLDKWKSLP